jgi:hypothetical protein
MSNILAFPSNVSMGEVVQEGMNLRDYFAAKIMQSMYVRFGGGAVVGNADGFLDHAAENAYVAADAMLRAREIQS